MTRDVWYETSRHPPHAAEIASNSALIQRRAAPIPRVSESVSDSVWRVPKPASRRMSASTRETETAATMSCSAESVSGGSWA